MLPLIFEVARCLDEGIVATAEEADMALLFGIGFPPFRGGLLKYADAEGLDRVAEAINGFASTVDKNRYELSSYLKNLLDNKKKFYDI